MSTLNTILVSKQSKWSVLGCGLDTQHGVTHCNYKLLYATHCNCM